MFSMSLPILRRPTAEEAREFKRNVIEPDESGPEPAPDPVQDPWAMTLTEWVAYREYKPGCCLDSQDFRDSVSLGFWDEPHTGVDVRPSLLAYPFDMQRGQMFIPCEYDYTTELTEWDCGLSRSFPVEYEEMAPTKKWDVETCGMSMPIRGLNFILDQTTPMSHNDPYFFENPGNTTPYYLNRGNTFDDVKEFFIYKNRHLGCLADWIGPYYCAPDQPISKYSDSDIGVEMHAMKHDISTAEMYFNFAGCTVEGWHTSRKPRVHCGQIHGRGISIPLTSLTEEVDGYTMVPVGIPPEDLRKFCHVCVVLARWLPVPFLERNLLSRAHYIAEALILDDHGATYFIRSHAHFFRWFYGAAFVYRLLSDNLKNDMDPESRCLPDPETATGMLRRENDRTIRAIYSHPRDMTVTYRVTFPVIAAITAFQLNVANAMPVVNNQHAGGNNYWVIGVIMFLMSVFNRDLYNMVADWFGAKRPKRRVRRTRSCDLSPIPDIEGGLHAQAGGALVPVSNDQVKAREKFDELLREVLLEMVMIQPGLVSFVKANAPPPHVDDEVEEIPDISEEVKQKSEQRLGSGMFGLLAGLVGASSMLAAFTHSACAKPLIYLIMLVTGPGRDSSGATRMMYYSALLSLIILDIPSEHRGVTLSFADASELRFLAQSDSRDNAEKKVKTISEQLEQLQDHYLGIKKIRESETMKACSQVVSMVSILPILCSDIMKLAEPDTAVSMAFTATCSKLREKELDLFEVVGSFLTASRVALIFAITGDLSMAVSQVEDVNDDLYRQTREQAQYIALGTYSEHGLTPVEIRYKVLQLRGRYERAIIGMTGSKRKVYDTRIAEVVEWEEWLNAFAKMGAAKMQNYTVLLYGGPKTGKTCSINRLKSVMHQVAGIQEIECVWNVTDGSKFDDGFTNATTCIVWDDAGKSLPEYRAQPVIDSVIRYFSPIATPMLQAEAHLKGKIFNQSTLGIVTSNASDIGILAEALEPGAGFRRLTTKVEMVPKKGTDINTAVDEGTVFPTTNLYSFFDFVNRNGTWERIVEPGVEAEEAINRICDEQRQHMKAQEFRLDQEAKRPQVPMCSCAFPLPLRDCRICTPIDSSTCREVLAKASEGRVTGRSKTIVERVVLPVKEPAVRFVPVDETDDDSQEPTKQVRQREAAEKRAKKPSGKTGDDDDESIPAQAHSGGQTVTQRLLARGVRVRFGELEEDLPAIPRDVHERLNAAAEKEMGPEWVRERSGVSKYGDVYVSREHGILTYPQVIFGHRVCGIAHNVTQSLYASILALPGVRPSLMLLGISPIDYGFDPSVNWTVPRTRFDALMGLLNSIIEMFYRFWLVNTTTGTKCLLYIWGATPKYPILAYFDFLTNHPYIVVLRIVAWRHLLLRTHLLFSFPFRFYRYFVSLLNFIYLAYQLNVSTLEEAGRWMDENFFEPFSVPSAEAVNATLGRTSIPITTCSAQPFLFTWFSLFCWVFLVLDIVSTCVRSARGMSLKEIALQHAILRYQETAKAGVLALKAISCAGATAIVVDVVRRNIRMFAQGGDFAVPFEMKKAAIDKREKMWDPWVHIPHKPTVHSIGATPGQLAEKIKSALCRIQYGYTRRDLGLNTTGLFLNNALLVLPKHLMHASVGTKYKEIFVKIRMSKNENPISTVLQFSSTWLAPGRDFVITQVDARPDVKDITKFIADAGPDGIAVGRIHRLDKNFERFEDKISLRKNEMQYESGDLVIQQSGYSYHVHKTARGFKPGDCASPITTETKCSIIGIHVAGHEHTGFGIPITQDDLQAAFKKFKMDPGFLNPTEFIGMDPMSGRGEDNMVLREEPHEHSMFRFMPQGSSVFFVGDTGESSSPRFKATPNPMADRVNQLFETNIQYCKPHTTKTKLFRKAAVIASVRTYAPNEVLTKAFEDYVLGFKDLKDSVPDWMKGHFVPLDEVLNGVEGHRYRNGIKTKTSAGHPHNCAKANCFEGEKPNLRPKPWLWKSLQRVYSKVGMGIHSGTAYKVFGKDEPLPPEKADTPRNVYGLNLEAQLVLQMVLARAGDFLMYFSRESETCVGHNVISREYHEHMAELYDDICVAVAKALNADSRSFDLTQCRRLRTTSANVILWILENIFEFDTAEMDIARKCANELVMPFVVMNGNIVYLPSLMPSGHPWTSLMDGIVTSLIVRMSWFLSHPDAKPGDFRKAMVLRTYGDDMNGLAKKGPDGSWDMLTFKEHMDSWGMKTTPADKVGELTPWVRTDELSFLKRIPAYHESLGIVVHQLEESSILRPFICYIPGPPFAEHMIECMRGAMDEYVMYGRKKYDWAQGNFVKLCEEYDIPLDDFVTQTYDAKIAQHRERLGLELGENLEKPSGVTNIVDGLSAQADEMVPNEGADVEVEGTAMEAVSANVNTGVAFVQDRSIEVLPSRVTQTGELLKREVLISRITWTGQEHMTVYPYSQWARNDYISSLLRGFRLWRGTLRLRIVTNANPGQYGMLRAYVTPFSPFTERASVLATGPQIFTATLTALRPNLVIELDGQTTHEMVIPYTYPTPNLETESLVAGSVVPARVDFHVIAPIQHFNGASTQVTMLVYCICDDPQLSVVTPMKAHAGDSPHAEEEERKVSNTLARVSATTASAATLFSWAPPLVTPLELISAASSAGANIARALGFSRPIVGPDTMVVPTASSPLAMPDVRIHAKRLAMSSTHELSIDASLMGDTDDPLAFSRMVSTPSMVDLIKWDKNHAHGAVLATRCITPFFRTPSSDGSKQFTLVPMAAVATQFAHWRGTIHVKVKACAHSTCVGQLRMYYDPVADRQDREFNVTTYESVAIDLREESEMEMAIGWNQPVLAGTTLTRKPNSSVPQSYIPLVTDLKPETNLNGMIAVVVDTPLSFAGIATAPSVYITVETWAAPDMVFYKHFPHGLDKCRSTSVSMSHSGIDFKDGNVWETPAYAAPKLGLAKVKGEPNPIAGGGTNKKAFDDDKQSVVVPNYSEGEGPFAHGLGTEKSEWGPKFDTLPPEEPDDKTLPPTTSEPQTNPPATRCEMKMTKQVVAALKVEPGKLVRGVGYDVRMEAGDGIYPELVTITFIAYPDPTTSRWDVRFIVDDPTGLDQTHTHNMSVEGSVVSIFGTHHASTNHVNVVLRILKTVHILDWEQSMPESYAPAIVDCSQQTGYTTEVITNGHVEFVCMALSGDESFTFPPAGPWEVGTCLDLIGYSLTYEGDLMVNGLNAKSSSVFMTRVGRTNIPLTFSAKPGKTVYLKHLIFIHQVLQAQTPGPVKTIGAPTDPGTVVKIMSGERVQSFRTLLKVMRPAYQVEHDDDGSRWMTWDYYMYNYGGVPLHDPFALTMMMYGAVRGGIVLHIYLIGSGTLRVVRAGTEQSWRNSSAGHEYLDGVVNPSAIFEFPWFCDETFNVIRNMGSELARNRVGPHAAFSGLIERDGGVIVERCIAEDFSVGMNLGVPALEYLDDDDAG